MFLISKQPREREFRKDGPISGEFRQRNFYVSPHEWNKQHLMPRLMNGEYVVFRGAWQSGKTTRLVELKEQLEAAGYLTC